LAHAFLKEPGLRGEDRAGCHDVRFGRPPKLNAHQPRALARREKGERYFATDRMMNDRNGRFRGKADVHDRLALASSVAIEATLAKLKSRSAASMRRESAREVNVVFNRDFLEVANENFNAHGPTARDRDQDIVNAPSCTVDMLCS
jgi:hypothetical protein